jgi:hypothetical protein
MDNAPSEKKDAGKDGEKKDAGKDVPPPTVPEGMRFEESLAKSVKGVLCIGVANAVSGPSPYIFVGKVVSKDINPTHALITMAPMQCTVDPWSHDCLGARWNPVKGQARETMPHYSMMMYFTSFNGTRNNKNRLPQAVKNAVTARNIQWYVAPEDAL